MLLRSSRGVLNSPLSPFWILPFLLLLLQNKIQRVERPSSRSSAQRGLLNACRMVLPAACLHLATEFSVDGVQTIIVTSALRESNKPAWK